MDRFDGLEIDVNRDRDRNRNDAVAKQHSKLDAALEQRPAAAAAADPRLAQLQQLASTCKDEAEKSRIESLSAVRSEYLSQCAKLREQGRNAKLPSLIFYEGLDAYCGNGSGGGNNANPNIRQEFRYIGKRGTVEQQDLELLEIAKNLVAQPGISTFAEYTAAFPHLLKNHCADDGSAATDDDGKQRLQQEAEQNLNLAKKQKEWWRRIGAQQEVETWWHQLAHPLIEREKEKSGYATKSSPSEQAELAQRILKSVGMALSQAWRGDRNTSQLGSYPPFWQPLISTGKYSGISLDEVLPNWNYGVEADQADHADHADQAKLEQSLAALGHIAIENDDDVNVDKKVTKDIQAVCSSCPFRGGGGSGGADMAAAAKRLKRLKKMLKKLDKKIAKAPENSAIEEKRQRCLEALRDSTDFVQNKIARRVLVS